MAGHTHNTVRSVGSKLKLGIALTGFILVAEVVGGLLSNSLALLSDAGHVFTDIIALSLSWYGVRQAERPPSKRMTFGYHRVGVIVAVINAISIFVIAAVILFEAYRRLQQPSEVNSLLMLLIAVVGLGVNAFVAFWLHKEQQSNLNVRSAFWHAIGDALASVGVIIGGIIILFTSWFWVDSVVSIFISFVIIFAAWRILREGLRVLLEATPQHVHIEEMVSTLNQIPGVKDVHDIHVWSISPELHSMSCHVLIDDLPTSQAAGIRQKIEDVLQHQFSIRHSTLQMECHQCDSNDVLCTLNFASDADEDKL